MILAETFFYLPETVWQALIAAMVTLVIARYAAQAKQSADSAKAEVKVAATKVEEVKTDLKATSDKADLKTDAMSDVLNDVHTLVNSNMAAQLKISSVALKRVAELTMHPDDVKAYEIARDAYTEHQAKQAVVDFRKEA